MIRMEDQTQSVKIFDYNAKESEKLIIQIARNFAHYLNIDDKDEDIFIRLIVNNLKELLLGRNGMLDSYYHTRLTKLLPEFYLNFDLTPEELEIDRNHGDGTKLWTIIKTIQKKYDIKNPKRKNIPNVFGKQVKSNEMDEMGMTGMGSS